MHRKAVWDMGIEPHAFTISLEYYSTFFANFEYGHNAVEQVYNIQYFKKINSGKLYRLSSRARVARVLKFFIFKKSKGHLQIFCS